MRSYLRVLGLALIAAGLCTVQGAPANAACLGFSGTADGFNKVTAVTRAQAAVAAAITEYKSKERLGAVSVTAMRATPKPYWRSAVSANLFHKPDIVKAELVYRLLGRRGLALCLHLGRQGLLVICKTLHRAQDEPLGADPYFSALRFNAPARAKPSPAASSGRSAE